ncbi:hypothetical protein FRC04_001425 [Tulasnella sp. 424]|nr:hypothetical protein FRC04_001425 [Tulasnella sp. 424]KAG8972701.1 hypothetical protein FRC05_009622 [Tulasnella sp. 425]
MLGTFKVATPSPPLLPNRALLHPQPKSFAPPHTLPLPPPLSPHSPPSPSPVSGGVESLKAQLAAGEALVKLLMKEKVEAISASRRLFVDIQNLQEQQIEWSKEKEDLMAKLASLSPLNDSDGHPEPEVNKTHRKSSKWSPRTGTDGETTIEFGVLTPRLMSAFTPDSESPELVPSARISDQ